MTFEFMLALICGAVSGAAVGALVTCWALERRVRIEVQEAEARAFKRGELAAWAESLRRLQTA